MVATGSKTEKVNHRIVEDSPPSVATDLGSLGGKKATSLAHRKPKISSNFDGQRRQGKVARLNKGDKVGGSPRTSKMVSCIKYRSPAKGASPQQGTETSTASVAEGNQGQAPAVTAKSG